MVRRGAGVALRTEIRTLEVTGADRVRYLNGMLSNDVSKLSVGEGLLAVKPNNKGKIEGLVRVRMMDEAVRLDLRDVVAAHVQEVLEKFIIMDDCAIRDVSDTREVLGVYGPRARDALGNLDPGELAPHAWMQVADVVVIRDPWLGVDGYELHVPFGQAKSVAVGLTAEPFSAEALEAMRIEAGVPIDGVDLGDDTIPMEARLERAIDFKKGCYIGQEVISRATNLGGIRHILVGFDVAGDEPPPQGAKVTRAGKVTGEVTSAVMSPTLGRLIAMGYVHKKDEIPGNPVTIEQDGKTWEATVANLPFVS